MLGEIEESEARAVALFRMRAVIELPLHDIAGGRTDGERPGEQASRCPLHMFAMRLRHMLSNGGVAAAQE